MRAKTQRPAGQRPATPRRSETRQRIIDAAGQLFREHGIDGVGVDAVMRLAGLTHGGFYLHFASKEALVAEVAHALLGKSAARWDDLSRTPDRDTALRRIVEPYLSLSHACSPSACALTTLGTDVARRSTARYAMDEPLRGMLSALERCLPDPEQATATLATMVGAVVLARLADDQALAEAFLAAAASAILSGANKTSQPASATPSTSQ